MLTFTNVPTGHAADGRLDGTDDGRKDVVGLVDGRLLGTVVGIVDGRLLDTVVGLMVDYLAQL